MAPLLHAFGQRYDLPISLSLYLLAAAGVVVISFVMVVVFAGEKLGEGAVRYPRWPVPGLAAAGRSPFTRVVGGAIGILALAIVIVTGLFGNQTALRNPSEFIVWVFFWAGLLIVSCLVGNLWVLISPWAALFDLVHRQPGPAPFRLPERLGIWPAVAIYFAFVCLELTTGRASVPALVAALAMGYSALTLVGMALFGREQWLGRVEVFSILFSVVGRFSPVEAERDQDGRLIQVYLRPWGAGLLRPQRAGWDWVVLIVLMLSSLAFDGILVTPSWQNFMRDTQGFWLPMGDFGAFLVKTGGLLLLTLTFFLVFVTIMRLVILLGRSGDPLEAITAFALTLVPIALVYNAAHNYSYLTVQSQLIVPLLSDPLGRGPARLATPSFALAGAALVWYLQVILIVFGHVIAVYLAHLRAGERFKTASRVLLSQYPMLLLMVLYTMTSLWILAQPITQERG